MSPYTIAAALTAPTGLAFLAAWPFWVKAKETIVGNTIGALIVTMSVFGLIAREYIDIERARRRCEELTRGVCAADTAGAFMKFAIYGFIGLAEIVALFVVADLIEHRRKERQYASEWRQ